MSDESGFSWLLNSMQSSWTLKIWLENNFMHFLITFFLCVRSTLCALCVPYESWLNAETNKTIWSHKPWIAPTTNRFVHMHGNLKRVSLFIHHDCAAETCTCSIPPKSDWVRCEGANLYLHKYFRTLLLSVSKFSGFNSKNRLFSHGFYLLDLFERYVCIGACWVDTP